MRRRLMIIIATVCCFGLASTTNVQGDEGYALRRSNVAGGGGTTTGGGYALLATTGEHDAGTIGGGGYSLTSGYCTSTSIAPNAPGLPTDLDHQAPKNRYVSLDLSTNTTAVAYDVTLASMKRCTGDERRACVVDDDCPGVCTGNNDLQCENDSVCGPAGPCLPTSPCVEDGSIHSVARFVGEPYTSACIPLDDCATQWFAELSNTPVYRTWTENAVHITDCTIVPCAKYDVHATNDGVVFGNPLTIGTIDKPHVNYADCVGPVSAGQYAPPDGFTNVTDVQAYLIANQGGATAPHTTWVDLHGAVIGSACTGGDCIVPQQVLNVGDLQTIKFGYLGQTYVETPGQDNPADCP